MFSYNNKKIALLGLSVEGVDSAQFFSREKAHVTCLDRRSKEELGPIYEKLQALTSDFQLGKEYLSDLNRFDLIVRSPGVSLRLPELVVAKSKGIPVTSLTKLFFDHCQAPIIGVTGTKGKGTTSTMIYEILKKEGKRVWLGGNVGKPLLSQIHHILQTDIVILELSSFQLEDLQRSPHIAVVLKITEDHLANFDPFATNYHESKDTYREAKKSLIRYQNTNDFVICNADDPVSVSFGEESKARKYFFSRSKDTVDSFVTNDTVILVWNKQKSIICTKNNIRLIGLHNLENIAAASLAGIVAGASVQSIRSVVQSFAGLPHRLEFVQTVNGVSYWDDSFSTVPETAIAAIQSFTGPVILIVGGSQKGSDYEELGKQISLAHIKALIVIGDMTEKILASVRKAKYTGTIVTGLRTMHEIVRKCQSLAVQGDTVLLSPACASFDMFKNYKERGNLFKHEVSLL